MDDIEKLKARFDICQLKVRHLRMLDAKNWNEYGALLTDDFTLDLTQMANVPVVTGRDTALNQIRTSMEASGFVHTAHIPEFEFNGDEARVIWAIQGRTINGPNQPAYTGYGQHHDRWVKRNGAWKLAAQKLITFHMDVDPPAAMPTAPRGGRHEGPVKDIESIKARIEITRLKGRHYRMLDTKNWEEYGKILAEDCEIDLTQTMDVPVVHGREAAVNSTKASMPPDMKTAHQVHMGEFEINGDEARVIWLIQARSVGAPDQPSYAGFGQHHELWTRRNGAWKLTKQRLISLHTQVFPPASGTATPRAGFATLKTGA